MAQKQSVLIAPGQTLRLQLEGRYTAQRVAGFALLAVSGGALLTSGAFGYVALRKDSQARRLDQQEPDNVQGYNDAVGSRNDFRLAAAVTAGAGLAVGIGGVLALLLERSDVPAYPPSAARSRAPLDRRQAHSISPELSGSSSSLRVGLRGVF